MANPNGVNQHDKFATEKKYGEVKRATELQKSAPMSGAPTPAISMPETSQRRAVQGRRGAPKPQKAPSGGVPPYEQEVASIWAEVAAQPGASELVKAIAARAMGMYGANQ